VTFTRKFNAKFGRGIPQNVLTLIERDQVEALAEANRNEDDTDGPVLTPFKQFNKARPADPVLPAVSVYKRRVKDIDQAEGQRVESTAEWAVEVAVEGPTEDRTMELLEIYVEAVDSVMRADPDAILERVADDVRGLVELDIVEHVYGQNVPDGQRHIRAAAITLTAKLFEV
jgi:hypothetical protein